MEKQRRKSAKMEELDSLLNDLANFEIKKALTVNDEEELPVWEDLSYDFGEGVSNQVKSPESPSYLNSPIPEKSMLDDSPVPVPSKPVETKIHKERKHRKPVSKSRTMTALAVPQMSEETFRLQQQATLYNPSNFPDLFDKLSSEKHIEGPISPFDPSESQKPSLESMQPLFKSRLQVNSKPLIINPGKITSSASLPHDHFVKKKKPLMTAQEVYTKNNLPKHSVRASECIKTGNNTSLAKRVRDRMYSIRRDEPVSSTPDVINIHITLADKSQPVSIQAHTGTTFADIYNAYCSEISLWQKEYFCFLEVQSSDKAMWLKMSGEVNSKEGNERNLVLKLRYFKHPLHLVDPLAIHIFYLHIQQNVVQGVYPTSETQCVRLAALQLQSEYGDHDETAVNLGSYLNTTVEGFFPYEHLQNLNSRYFERRVYKKHRQLKGLTQLQAKCEYLKMAQSLIPTYGCTAFNVFDEKTEIKLFIGENGILLPTPYKRIYRFYHFKDIYSWISIPNGFEISLLASAPTVKETKVFICEEWKKKEILILLSGYYSYLKDGYEAMQREKLFFEKKDYFEKQSNQIQLSSSPPSGSSAPKSGSRRTRGEGNEDIPSLPDVELPVTPHGLQHPLLFLLPFKRSEVLTGFSRCELFKDTYIKRMGENVLPKLIQQIDSSLDRNIVYSELDLSDSQISKEDLLMITHILDHISQIKPVLLQLEENICLTSIDLSYNHLPQDVSIIGDLVRINVHLRRLTLVNCFFGPREAHILSHSLKSAWSLEEIDLSENPLQTQGFLYIVKSLKDHSSCKVLKFNAASLDEKACQIVAQMISQNPYVTSLSLAKNKLSESGISKIVKAIVTNRNVVFIDLSYNSIGNKNGTKLLDWLVRNYKVEGIRFSGANLSSSFVHELVESLNKPYSNIRHISLSDNDFSKIFQRFFLTLQENTKIEDLEIGGNRIEKQTGTYLIKYLEATTVLKRLTLNHTHLSEETLCSLANGLNDIPLEYLNISNNKNFKKELVASAWGNSLSKNETLRELHVSECSLTQEGLLLFFSCLRKNTSLQVLNLSGNKLGDDGFVMLGGSLCLNKGLEHLKVRNTHLTTESLCLLLNKLFEKNYTLCSIDVNSNEQKIDFTSPVLKDILRKTFFQVNYHEDSK